MEAFVFLFENANFAIFSLVFCLMKNLALLCLLQDLIPCPPLAGPRQRPVQLTPWFLSGAGGGDHSGRHEQSQDTGKKLQIQMAAQFFAGI